MVQSLVVIDGLCHQHVLVHEDDGEHFSWRISLIARRLVECPTRVKADLACSTKCTVTFCWRCKYAQEGW